MRTLLVLGLLAASAAASPAAASCSLGQLGTNPWQCGPAVPEDERDRHDVVPCDVTGGLLTAAAYVPYAIEVTIECTVGGATAETRREGPAAFLATHPVASGPACTRVSWWYPDYSQGAASYGAC